MAGTSESGSDPSASGASGPSARGDQGPSASPARGPSAPADPRPVLFVTTEIPPDRVGAFRALAALTPVEFALFGGGMHATAGVSDHGLPAIEVREQDVFGLARSGRYRAVVAGTVGRIALPAAWFGAELAKVPFVLWSALWAHPRSAAHLPGALLLRLLYRRADVVVTYGPHVSRFAKRHGARHTVVAPQAVDADFWSAPVDAQSDTPAPVEDVRPVGAVADAIDDVPQALGSAPDTSGAQPMPRLLFVGRDDPGKGVDWLLEAWDASGLGRDGRAELRLVGPASERSAGHAGVVALGPVAPARVRDEMRAAAAVVVPSERTATFREPWGLVVNEAMHAGKLVIASTEVGAVAGGLVQGDRTGLVVPAGNLNALAQALVVAATPETPNLQAIRAAGRETAGSYTHDAWAAAFAAALNGSVACRP